MMTLDCTVDAGERDPVTAVAVSSGPACRVSDPPIGRFQAPVGHSLFPAILGGRPVSCRAAPFFVCVACPGS